jgi:DNA segregation ATPase FtsK/SpoIIIE, S-DNA-T family
VVRTILFNRKPRIQETLPEGEVEIPAPPKTNPPAKMGWLQLLLPLSGVFVMLAVYGGLRGDQGGWLLAIPMVAMSGISIITSTVGKSMQRKEQERKIAEAEEAYKQALQIKREELENLRKEQQRVYRNAHPDLDALVLWAQKHSPDLWRRRPVDEDFLNVRIGVGTLPSTVEVSVPTSPMPDPALEPAQKLQAEFSHVPSVPVAADLRDGPITVVASPSQRRKVARSMLINLAVHHSPDEVYLAAIYSPGHDVAWQWLKWLPHTYILDSQSPFLTLGYDSRSAQEMLDSLLEVLHQRQNMQQNSQSHAGKNAIQAPWIVLVIEDFEAVRDAPAIHLLLSPEGRNLNVTAIFMTDTEGQAPMGSNGIIRCHPEGTVDYMQSGAGKSIMNCMGDMSELQLADRVARYLAPLRVYTLLSDREMPSYVRLLDIFNIGDMERHDVVPDWEKHQHPDFLKVPIGERRGNQALVLDLNHTGHGPHGLVAGTTGSGKSELLQTLVVSLALRHHPYDLGFVLVDFKGGGTFADLQYLPHTLGMVTDLSGSLAMRALVALEAEVDRRKRLFNEAGVNDITPYERAYWKTQTQGIGNVSEPLPHLVIIVDEFAELVSDYPEFMDGLIAIARVGRSLGLHLILATQSPGGVVNQQIWANAKFRICLRVEARQESMDMLHRPEAANLPRVPGRGYMQVGNNDVFELFQVARVAGTYRKQGQTGPILAPENPIFIAEILQTGERDIIVNSLADQKKNQDNERTDIEVVVEELVSTAQEINISPLPSPWPEPLPKKIVLPELLSRVELDSWVNIQSQKSPDLCGACHKSIRYQSKFCPYCGHRIESQETVGIQVSKDGAYVSPENWLAMTLGLVDDPGHQRQYPLQINLSEQDGQFLIIGIPGSGYEMLLRTLVMSLSLTHTPEELHFYLMEFGGQMLRVFESLPHVGGVFNAMDRERIQRLSLLLIDELEGRKQIFNQKRVDSLRHLREMVPQQAPPAIVIILTGFGEFRTNFMEEAAQITRLIREGGPYGLHFILVGNRSGDIPSSVSSVISRRVVLALADPADYSVALGTRLKVAKNRTIPYGRGWYGRPPLEFQTASPSYELDEQKQVLELMDIASDIDEAWAGARPEPVEALPEVVLFKAKVLSKVDLSVSPLEAVTNVPVGVDGLRMHPLFVDLVKDGPNFIVSSTPQGGKTTLLRTWILSLAKYNSPQQVQFVLVSGRRDSLSPLRSLPHILSYCRLPEEIQEKRVIDHILLEIDRREKAISENVMSRATLSHIVVVFDDYDEFSQVLGSDNDLMSDLGKLAKSGRDVEIHTIVAGPLPDMGVNYQDMLVKQLKIGRSGFVLHVLDAAERNPIGLQLRASEVSNLPPGRGYVVRNGNKEMVHVAMAGDAGEVQTWAKQVSQFWLEEGEAAQWDQEVVDQLKSEEEETPISEEEVSDKVS